MTMTTDPHGDVAPRPLSRPVADIAGMIIEDCERHLHEVPPAAEPYLHTMLGLATTDLNGHYGHQRVADVVQGALDNLHDWRTDLAWTVKRELRAALATVRRP